MLQRLIAAVLGVLGLVVGGLGIASATAWRADDVLVADARTGSDDRIVLTDAGVLDLAGNPVTVRVTAADDAPVVLAVGRDTDVTAWVGADPHVRVTGLSDWHELRTTAVEGEPAPSAEATADAAAADLAADAAADPAAADAAPTVPDPRGSDLWVVEETGEGSATLTWQAKPGRWSLIAASLGDTPPVVQLSWPQTVTTPWLWPCVAAGALLLLAGIALAARLWLRARRGADDWRPVGTGPVPVLTGAGAAPVAVSADAGETVVLTRRQMRDAGLTGETRSRRRDRAGRAATGEHPTVADETPARVARGTSPASAPGEQVPADAPVPRWAAAAAAVPSAPATATRGSRREADRAPWGASSAPAHQPSPETSREGGGVLVGRTSGAATGSTAPSTPTGRRPAPGDVAPRSTAPDRAASGAAPSTAAASHAPAPDAPPSSAAAATPAASSPTGASPTAPSGPGAAGEPRRGPAWAAQLGRRAPGAPSAYQSGPSGPGQPGQPGPGPDAPSRADGRAAASPGSPTGPARTERSASPAGPTPGWTPSAPARPSAGPSAGPGASGPGQAPATAGTRLPGPPGRLSHPDATPAASGARASWLPSGPSQPSGSAPQEAPRARAGAAGPQPGPSRGGAVTGPSRPDAPGPDPRAGVGAAAHRVAPSPAGTVGDRGRPAQPHAGHHAAPSEAPAARADAWRRAWGFPEPPEDEHDQGRTHGEADR